MQPIKGKGKVVKVGNSYYIVIPKFIYDSMDFKKGDKVVIILMPEGYIKIVKEE